MSWRDIKNINQDLSRMKVSNKLKKIENNTFVLLEHKKETKLHMVRIRFGTFSFDRVTKLLKASWIDKLSHFGGTAGLFTGCSFISAFEFLVSLKLRHIVQ